MSTDRCDYFVDILNQIWSNLYSDAKQINSLLSINVDPTCMVFPVTIFFSLDLVWWMAGAVRDPWRIDEYNCSTGGRGSHRGAPRPLSLRCWKIEMITIIRSASVARKQQSKMRTGVRRFRYEDNARIASSASNAMVVMNSLRAYAVIEPPLYLWLPCKSWGRHGARVRYRFWDK